MSWLFSVFILLTFTSCTAPVRVRTIASVGKTPTLEDHQKATEEFKTLHFFTQGRGMMISPGLIDVVQRSPERSKQILIEKSFGLNYIEGNIVGLFEAESNGYNIGVLGCVACHSGRAAGRFYIGLGNKNIDTYAIGRFTLNAEEAWKVAHTKKMTKDDHYRGLTHDAIEFSQTLSNKNIANFTQGLVPTGIIRTWFYKQKNMPLPDNLPRAAVKVPHLWGYGEKRKVGTFSDGGGNGKLPGWAIAVELVANQRPEVIRKYLPKVEHAEELLAQFLPPKYPFAVDRSLAEKGKIIFEKSCSKCHGSYQRDDNDYPIYEVPKWIKHEVVKTDDDRLSGIETFVELVRDNPLSDILIDDYKGRGYLAPRLEGVWARFPYLHNASVPTIMDLLTPAEKRPKKFSVRNSGEEERFDKENLGLKLSGLERKGIIRPALRRRSIYDTHKRGQSNKGHEFNTDIDSKDKKALIEYLKTL